MVYITVLNWNSAVDTLNCVKSLLSLSNVDFKIIVIDNNSTDNSYSHLSVELPKVVDGPDNYTEIDTDEYESFKVQEIHKLCLIQSGANLGYAGGNNIGIKVALNQDEVDYIWVVNNDTEFDSLALKFLVDKCNKDKEIGICGSRLVCFEEREIQQSVGGLHNKYLCTTRQYGFGQNSAIQYNDEHVSDQIDYVVGAAMLFSKKCLKDIGIFTSDYFLYYEELDICIRAKRKGYKLGVCSDSYVYHKEGASTEGGKSEIADFCSIRNRLLFTKRFYPQYFLFVWLSLYGVALNRFKRKEFKKMRTCFKLIFTFGNMRFNNEK